MQAWHAMDFGVLGEIVRAERQRRGLSQEALAELARVSRTHIGGVERGEVSLSLATFEAVASGFGMTASELMVKYERRSKPTP